MPEWLVWGLRIMMAGVFAVLIYSFVTAPRRRSMVSGDFRPGTEQFVMPDGTGSRLGNPYSIGPLSTSGSGFSTEYWPEQASDGPIDLTIRARQGPWTGVALELSEMADDEEPGGSKS